MTQGPGSPAGTILVVEDHHDTRAAVALALRNEGYHVLTASGATEAVTLVQAHPGDISLLISEVLLWGMTGPELFGRLRQRRSTLRVLFISGYSEGVLQENGVSPSTSPFLRKPFGPPVLVAKVREVLRSTPSSLAGSGN